MMQKITEYFIHKSQQAYLIIMNGAKFIAYDPNIHKEKIFQIFEEYRDWFLEGFKANTNKDYFQLTGLKIFSFIVSL